ncbi:MAG TPA: hypothetical protein VMU28_08115 [Terriglobales bacterium]|nr:hypothetical protein [Terriglobales bacterium]
MNVELGVEAGVEFEGVEFEGVGLEALALTPALMESLGPFGPK